MRGQPVRRELMLPFSSEMTGWFTQNPNTTGLDKLCLLRSAVGILGSWDFRLLHRCVE